MEHVYLLPRRVNVGEESMARSVERAAFPRTWQIAVVKSRPYRHKMDSFKLSDSRGNAPGPHMVTCTTSLSVHVLYWQSLEGLRGLEISTAITLPVMFVIATKHEY